MFALFIFRDLICTTYNYTYFRLFASNNIIVNISGGGGPFSTLEGDDLCEIKIYCSGLVPELPEVFMAIVLWKRSKKSNITS